jgi:hypothetical protein
VAARSRRRALREDTQLAPPDPATQPWAVKLFARHRDDDQRESCPSAEFLRSCPKKVATELLATLDAVAESPPPQFTGGGMWEAMHGAMSGYFEARRRGPDRRLYRLFCVLERAAPGLDRPSIVVITGMSKPVGASFSDAEYASVRRLGDEYRGRTPRNVR